MAAFLVLLFFLLNISLMRNLQGGASMEGENLNQQELAASKEHREVLDSILRTLSDQHRKGNLEEVLVYFTLESEPDIRKFCTVRTGRTLHQISELIDDFARELRAQQN